MSATATWTFLPVGSKFTMVDAEDYERFKDWSWHIVRPGGRPYVQGRGSGLREYLHRLILGLEKGDPRDADHINGDPLDNRRCNLRAINHRENIQNRRGVNANNTSGYRGVYFSAGRWRAKVQVNGKNHYFGGFDTPAEANAAAVAFRREHMATSEMDRG